MTEFSAGFSGMPKQGEWREIEYPEGNQAKCLCRSVFDGRIRWARSVEESEITGSDGPGRGGRDGGGSGGD